MGNGRRQRKATRMGKTSNTFPSVTVPTMCNRKRTDVTVGTSALRTGEFGSSLATSVSRYAKHVAAPCRLWRFSQRRMTVIGKLQPLTTVARFRTVQQHATQKLDRSEELRGEIVASRRGRDASLLRRNSLYFGRNIKDYKSRLFSKHSRRKLIIN